ncbi:hypothetical protein [Sinomicrobium oceani]|uniref:hypothetical protein n=1 Tax=Sinomicrobium oceani TaxID=1150368 RepID=UPI00227C1B2F|nr:hypothetical protein [Sinomicrobium oceani]
MREKVIQVIENLFNDEEFSNIFNDKMSMDDKLQCLISESMYALMLVTTLEDEFDIEFDDDEIDFNFFSNMDNVVEKTLMRLQYKRK